MSKQVALDAVRGAEPGTYEHVWPVSTVYEDVRRCDEPESFATIAKACGLRSTWEILPADRHLYYNYEAGYYYALERHKPDWFIRRVMTRRFRIVEDIFDTFDPDIIIAPNFVSPFHILLHGYAQQRGVTMVGIIDSKVRGRYLASTDPQARMPHLIERFREIEQTGDSPFWADAREYVAAARADFVAPDYLPATFGRMRTPPVQVARALGKTVARAALNTRRRRTQDLWVKGVIGLDNAPLRLMVRDVLARQRNLRHARRYPWTKPAADRPAILFPLQMQPEAMQDVAAPYFADQVALVRQVALAMPGDHVLYVKEHPGCLGLRDRRFYDRLNAIPNVRLIDPRITGHDVLRSVAAVVTINGTIAFENALEGRPSVVMGNLGGFSALPHVYRHQDVTTLTETLSDVLATDHTSPAHDHALYAYIAAVMEKGAQVDYTGIWERDLAHDKEPIYRLYAPFLAAAAGGSERPRMTNEALA